MLLGRGGMADVYFGALKGAEGFIRPVVLKRAVGGRGATAEQAREGLIQESRLCGLLNHPHVVHIYDLFESEQGLTLAMEYVQGTSLQSLVELLREEGGQIPWAVASRMGADVARGLHHAHHATAPDGSPLAVIHRDVSPKNLLITEDGVTKVADFGIARSSLRELTATAIVKGTPSYFSPEQARGEPLDWRTDVFSLGVVLHELFSQHYLFLKASPIATMKAILRESPPPLPDTIPRTVRTLVKHMLTKRVDQRELSMGEVADTLETAIAGRGGSERDVAQFLQAECSAQIQARRQRVSELLTGSDLLEGSSPEGGALGKHGAMELEGTSTWVALERALDHGKRLEKTVVDRTGAPNREKSSQEDTVSDQTVLDQHPYDPGNDDPGNDDPEDRYSEGPSDTPPGNDTVVDHPAFPSAKE